MARKLTHTLTEKEQKTSGGTSTHVTEEVLRSASEPINAFHIFLIAAQIRRKVEKYIDHYFEKLKGVYQHGRPH